MRHATGVEAALDQLSYLNMIVVSAAAAPQKLPYVHGNQDLDLQSMQQALGSLVCLLQAHFMDLAVQLQGNDSTGGRFRAFQSLTCDTTARIRAGDAAIPAIHRHIRNMFAFGGVVHLDQPGTKGSCTFVEDHDYHLAVTWLMDVLYLIERGMSLDHILGEAQNTDVCTRLCFGDAVKSLEMWKRDLRLIMPTHTTRM